MSKIKRLYFLVPVYNESQSIYDLLLQLDSFSQEVDQDCKVLIINDASQDDSIEWIEKAKKNIKSFNLEIINHQINKGLQGALNTGFEALRQKLQPQDIIVTMDGDNTHNPYLVLEMLKKHEQGADLVIASRYCEQSRVKGVSRERLFFSWGAKWLYKIFWNIKGVKDYTCLFRSHEGSLVQRLLEVNKEDILKQKSFACTTELLSKLNIFNPIITEVPMLLNYDKKKGKSNAPILKTILTSLKIIIKKV